MLRAALLTGRLAKTFGRSLGEPYPKGPNYQHVEYTCSIRNRRYGLGYMLHIWVLGPSGSEFLATRSMSEGLNLRVLLTFEVVLCESPEHEPYPRSASSWQSVS